MASLRFLAKGARLLLNYVRGGMSHANVQITNRCNMRCGFCTFPERSVAPEDELTVEEWRGVARTLSGAGSVVVSIEGGEPLLRADAPEIVRAFARWHHPWLYTNGWHVTPGLARALWAAGLSEVGVSLDYATADRHDASRRTPGAFSRAVAAVQHLAAASPRGPRRVHVLSILMRDNLDELEPLLALSSSLGVRHMVTFLSTTGIYRSGRAQKPPDEPVSGRLLALKARFPHFAIFRSYVEGIDRFLAGQPPPCGAGLVGMNVDHRGQVSPCIELAHLAAADLTRDPWESVRAKLAAVAEPRTCRKCWTLCRGGNEAMAGGPRWRDWKDFLSEFV